MSSPRDQGYFPPVSTESRRRSSSAAAGRYTPQEYAGTPATTQGYGQHLDPNHQPFPPAGTPVHADPPYPDDVRSTSPHMSMPSTPRRPSAADVHFRRDSTNLYQEALRRPSFSGSGADRRLSHDSRRSHHSHHSHNSPRSSHHDDRLQRYDGDDLPDYGRRDEADEGRESSYDRPHHNHRHSHQGRPDDDSLAAYRQRQKDRGENVSRSLGGSLMSVFSPLKYLFEPRDKY